MKQFKHKLQKFLYQLGFTVFFLIIEIFLLQIFLLYIIVFFIFRPSLHNNINENLLQLHSSTDAITFLPSQTFIANSEIINNVQAAFYLPNFSGIINFIKFKL